MAECVYRAAAGADKRCGDAVSLQESDDAIDGVAFGDPTEIELDTGNIESNCARRWAKDDVGIPDTPPRLAQLDVGGHMAIAFEESPRLHQRPDRDVEGAIGLDAVVERSR